jgi:CheY-like chemotaxis protein
MATKPNRTSADAARRILVVDDNADSAESLALLLRLMGHDVETARDGAAGIAAAGTFGAQVVFLDLGMPHLNGYDACRRMRQLPGGDGLTLIALTGWGQDEDRRRTAEAGFDAHIVKPIDAAALTNLLATLQR